MKHEVLAVNRPSRFLPVTASEHDSYLLIYFLHVFEDCKCKHGSNKFPIVSLKSGFAYRLVQSYDAVLISCPFINRKLKRRILILQHKTL